MKTHRTFPWLHSFLMLLVTLPSALQAQYNYETHSSTITITGYAGPGGAVLVPDTINGLSVTSIGDKAFFASSGLTSVTIPDSVSNIGLHAFDSCFSLTSITIGNRITGIPDRAFLGCGNLTSITMGNR